MKYLCLAYGDQKKLEALSEPEREALFAGCRLHDEEMRRTGGYLQGISLEWDAITIRPKGGKPVVSDGPFIESRELVGGLVIIEARDLNDAVRIASLHPAAKLGETIGWAVELRPIGVCEALR
jgi:hypothetical protein